MIVLITCFCMKYTAKNLDFPFREFIKNYNHNNNNNN